MKVEQNNTGVVAGGLERPGLDRNQPVGGDRRAAREQQRSSGDSGDRVQLSEFSRRLKELAAESPERAARLERLRNEVRANRYNADARQTSRRLLQDGLGQAGLTRSLKPR